MEHKKLIQKIARKFAKNEDANFHSENAILLAVNFGTDKDVEDAKRIKEQHHKIGYITTELLEERHQIYARLYPELVRWMNIYQFKKR